MLVHFAVPCKLKVLEDGIDEFAGALLSISRVALIFYSISSSETRDKKTVAEKHRVDFNKDTLAFHRSEIPMPERGRNMRSHCHAGEDAFSTEDSTRMIDYYEFLQISPNADFDTIQRVYRFLASRFHPDNSHTGDAEKFHLLRTAYDVLSEKTKRTEYDAARNVLTQEPLSSTIDFMDSLEGELNRRLAVLAVLYRRRRANTDMPEVTLAEIEESMGFPRDYLDFTLWYLVKKGYISKSDNGQYALTADGVDFVEAQRPNLPTLNKMLTSGQATTDEEIDQATKQATAETEHARQSQSKSTRLISHVPHERRSGLPDRRVGEPDLRAIKTERRVGPRDRRSADN